MKPKTIEQNRRSTFKDGTDPTKTSMIPFLLGVTLFVLVTLKTDLPESAARGMGRAIDKAMIESSELLSGLSNGWKEFQYQALRLR